MKSGSSVLPNIWAKQSVCTRFDERPVTPSVLIGSNNVKNKVALISYSEKSECTVVQCSFVNSPRVNRNSTRI